MHRSAVIGAAALLPALIAGPVGAQTVVGVLVERGTDRAVEGALVVLLDSAGRQAGAGMSNGDGRFKVRAAEPGRYVLRAERIGYRSASSEVLELGAGQLLEYRLEAPIFAIPLAGIDVEREPRCVIRPAEGLATAQVWEEARKALAAAAWFGRERLTRFEMIRSERDLDPDRLRVVRQETRSTASIGARPYESLPAELLAAEGFVRTTPDGVYFHAPDADVLLSDAFLDTHCMRLTEGRGATRGRIGLVFEPVEDRYLPEIAGTFWLDREIAALQFLEYRYVNLDYEVPTDRLGGRVEFDQVPGGAWIVRRWWIRMPMIAEEDPGPSRRGARRKQRLIGIREDGGEVVVIENALGARMLESPRATLTGIVFDSTRMAPLAGARVQLSGTPYEATSGADGSFEFATLPEAEYTAAFTHPRLDSLPGFAPPTRSVVLRTGLRASVGLAVPPLDRILDEACPPARRRRRAPGVTLPSRIFGVLNLARPESFVNRQGGVHDEARPSIPVHSLPFRRLPSPPVRS